MNWALDESRPTTFAVVLPAGETRTYNVAPDTGVIVISAFNAKANGPLNF